MRRFFFFFFFFLSFSLLLLLLADKGSASPSTLSFFVSRASSAASELARLLGFVEFELDGILEEIVLGPGVACRVTPGMFRDGCFVAKVQSPCYARQYFGNYVIRKWCSELGLVVAFYIILYLIVEHRLYNQSELQIIYVQLNCTLL